MDARELLLSRESRPLLTEPGPTDDQLSFLFQAALRAPDHARLKPWRFIVIRNDARNKLGKLFAQAAQQDKPDLSEEALKRHTQLPLRAPVLLTLVCCHKDHPKVPVIEQRMSLATAAENMLLATHAQGLGGIWRTGTVCYHSIVAEGLQLSSDEEILGFLYLGTPSGNQRKRSELDPAGFVSEWGAE
ncbi:putative NAD(P)H nitroreductase YdjA [invertebrate metagenome]|uniref:Putative NAD(P)H nitroreductase YdjA n=1 Tax=invertebrate metagenome TaxID=1711999 RepID=A0A2H9T5H0_9ZZZZ